MSILQTVCFGTLWSLVLAMSVLGFGRIIPSKTLGILPEWAKAIVGVGLFTILGSIADLFGVAYFSVLASFVLIGAVLWFATKGPQALWKDISPISIAAIPITMAAIILAFLGAYSYSYNQNWDDVSGYWPVCIEMGTHGSSLAPLSLRRALTWGGQFPLQTAGMVASQDIGGYIYDRSLGIWLILIFLLHYFKGNVKPGWAAVAGVALLIVPQHLINSTPTLLAAMLLAGLYFTKDSIIASALISATICSMRSQLIIPALMFNAVSVFQSIHKNGWKIGIKEGLAKASLASVFLIPAVIVYWKQFGSPAFFIKPNTIDPAYLSFIGHDSWATFSNNFFLLIFPSTGMLTILILLCTQKVTRIPAAIGCITTAFFVWSMPEYSRVEWIRYAWPLLAATLLVLVTQWPKKASLLTALSVLIIGAPLFQIVASAKNALNEQKIIPTGDYLWWGTRKVQAEIPKGATVIIHTGQPNQLDFERQHIISWDSIGAVGHAPQNSDPKEWKAWMEKYGADYFVLPNPKLKTKDGRSVIDLCATPINKTTDLPNYRRVWYPSRTKTWQNLEAFIDKVPHTKANADVIINKNDL